MLGHSGPEHELAVASAIKSRLQQAFAEEEFNDWGWTSSRMQRSGLARSPKQLGDNHCKVWGEAAGSRVCRCSRWHLEKRWLPFPVRASEGPSLEGQWCVCKERSSFSRSDAKCCSRSHKYCRRLILLLELAAAIKPASRCCAARNDFSAFGFLAL